MIPFSDTSPSAGASFGMTHFTENGTVDVRAVRDFSQMVLQGTIDLSIGLLGLEPFSQTEFDARDINELRNPPMGFSPQATQALSDNWVGGTIAPIDPNLPTPQRRHSSEIFLEYEEWGITFEGIYPTYGGGTMMMARSWNVLLHGQLVSGLFDNSSDGIAELLASSDCSEGNLWVRVIRDESGHITELNIEQS